MKHSTPSTSPSTSPNSSPLSSCPSSPTFTIKDDLPPPSDSVSSNPSSRSSSQNIPIGSVSTQEQDSPDRNQQDNLGGTEPESDPPPPVLELIEQFPAMDWGYLFDREHGELFLDIGISWNPAGEEPLVSLWRLDKLDASFGKGGFNMGTIHNISTLARYGGMQAEMSKERSRRTHITYKQSYNLAYEVTRQRTNRADLFDLKEAYVGDGNFGWEVSELVSMYEGKAKERNYGSRDEYRLGGHAVLAIIPHLKDLVRKVHITMSNLKI